MEKKKLTTQADDVLLVIKTLLHRVRKDVFKFYIKTVEPKLSQLLEDIKNTVQHSDIKSKFKHPPTIQHLPLSRFILWLGIAASITGLLILINPNQFIGWQWLMVPLIAVTGPWFLDFFRESSKEAKDLLEGYEGQYLVGKIFRLKSAISNGESTISVKKVTWTLKGDDCPKGCQVRVVAVGEKVLYVTKVG